MKGADGRSRDLYEDLSSRRRDKTNIVRTVFLIALIAGGLLTSLGEIARDARAEVPAQRFELLEATVPQLQAALTAGTVTSRDLVRMYLARIDAFYTTSTIPVPVTPAMVVPIVMVVPAMVIAVPPAPGLSGA